MMTEPPCLFYAPSYYSDFFVNLSSRFRVHIYDFLGTRNSFTGIKCHILSQKDDGHYMRRCVELAKKATGHTSPNPMVGCVIVKDGEIVGEGFHPKAGQPHAEVFALRNARGMARYGTAYVSLEPCNHYGRTPPCTDALIEAGVRKVVVGMVDPNPIVASTGLSRLRAAGIEVVSGVEYELCMKLNEAYVHFILEKMPFVTLRYSISMNGALTASIGDGSTDRGGYYSELLKENDAVIILSLLPPQKITIPESKEPGASQPLVILKGQNYGCSTENTSRVVVFTEDLEVMLGYCYGRGICSVLVDVRDDSDSYEVLMKKNLVQKFVVEMLPVWEGGPGRDRGLMDSPDVSLRRRIRNLRSRLSSESVLIEGYLCGD